VLDGVGAASVLGEGVIVVINNTGCRVKNASLTSPVYLYLHNLFFF